MQKYSRRDLGYSIISRFELLFREHIERKLIPNENLTNVIPKGVIEKAEFRANADISSVSEILDQSDFPDLTEISIYKNNFSLLFPKYRKEALVDNMSILYSLRCKIAHVKGFFTSIDLDKLIETSISIGQAFTEYRNYKTFLYNIENNPDTFLEKVPLDFTIDYLESNGVLNNLPVPDYEYEGGFVGRDEDIRKILGYLIGNKFPVITITGAGGVGKTSLALKVVQEYSQKPENSKFDAIIWLSAKENKLSTLGIEDIDPSLKSYEDFIDTILNVVELNSSGSILEKEELVYTLIEISKGVLIIVDNLETISDERIINFIIDSPNKVKFLITSRKGLGQVERRHELKQLKEAEAVYLFRQTARDKQLNNLIKLEDKIVKKYVNRISCYPLAIKWVLGLVKKGKEINKVIDSINDATGDIARFCFEQIFSELSESSKLLLYSICCFDHSPTAGVLSFVVGLTQEEFDDAIEDLILVSLIIPEQFKNEQDEIGSKYSILSLTEGFIKQELSKKPELKLRIESKISEVQGTIATTEKAKREYRYSLSNLGAITEEEKVAAILVQTALQKYQANRYEEAVDNYKSAIKIAPRFSTIYRNWAVMESFEGNLNDADSLMEKAYELSPKDPQILLLWGNIYKKAKRFVEAHQKYENALLLAPDDHIILNALAETKNRLGSYEIADQMFKQALEIGISLASKKHEIINRTCLIENLIQWSEYFFKDRNLELAEEKLKFAKDQCEKLIKLDPTDAKSISLRTQCDFKLGIFYKRTNQLPISEYYFNNLIKINPVSNREDYYIVNGTIEYCNLTQDKNDKDFLLSLLVELKERFPFVFQKNGANVQERISELKNRIANGIPIKKAPDIKVGEILKVNDAGNFILIKVENETILGGMDRIVNPEVSRLYIGQKVEFLIYENQNTGKRKATDIKLI